MSVVADNVAVTLVVVYIVYTDVGSGITGIVTDITICVIVGIIAVVVSWCIVVVSWCGDDIFGVILTIVIDICCGVDVVTLCVVCYAHASACCVSAIYAVVIGSCIAVVNVCCVYYVYVSCWC